MDLKKVTEKIYNIGNRLVFIPNMEEFRAMTQNITEDGFIAEVPKGLTEMPIGNVKILTEDDKPSVKNIKMCNFKIKVVKRG